MIVKCLSENTVAHPQHGIVYIYSLILEDKADSNKGTMALKMEILRKSKMRDIEAGKHYNLQFIPFKFIPKKGEDNGGGKQA